MWGTVWEEALRMWESVEKCAEVWGSVEGGVGEMSSKCGWYKKCSWR